MVGTPFLFGRWALGAATWIKHNTQTYDFYLGSGHKMRNPYVMHV
jgi:hypothetical protein